MQLGIWENSYLGQQTGDFDLETTLRMDLRLQAAPKVPYLLGV